MIQRLSRVAPTVAVAGTLLLQLIGPSAPLRAQTQAGYWPQGAVGALSLTFDDGMPSQLERAVPVLNRLGLKATFYVNPNYSVEWDKHAPEWRALIAQGHELSNHTDKHPCSCQND